MLGLLIPGVGMGGGDGAVNVALSGPPASLRVAFAAAPMRADLSSGPLRSDLSALPLRADLEA